MLFFSCDSLHNLLLYHVATHTHTTGVGFVGRHLTAYLINQKLASKVRVVDKVPPATGWLNKEHSVSPS